MRCWGKQRQLRTYVLLGTPCCRCFAPAPIFIWVLKICLIVFWYLWTVRGEETTFFLKIFQGILMWQAVISQGKKPNGWRHVFRDLIKDLFFSQQHQHHFPPMDPLKGVNHRLVQKASWMGVVHVTDGLDFVACWDGWFRTTPIKGHSGYLN